MFIGKKRMNLENISLQTNLIWNKNPSQDQFNNHFIYGHILREILGYQQVTIHSVA